MCCIWHTSKILTLSRTNLLTRSHILHQNFVKLEFFHRKHYTEINYMWCYFSKYNLFLGPTWLWIAIVTAHALRTTSFLCVDQTILTTSLPAMLAVLRVQKMEHRRYANITVIDTYMRNLILFSFPHKLEYNWYP